MSAREKIIDWLNDAHAMERALVEVLEQHAKDAKDDPEVKSRIEQHIEETQRQAETVAECIKSLDGSVSRSKGAFAKMFGATQGMANKAMPDTMIKNALSDYAAEHFEIASYRALIEACQQAGENEVAGKLTTILHEEEAMAQFLEKKLPMAVRESVSAAK